MRIFAVALCALVCLEGAAQAEVATHYGQEFAGIERHPARRMQ